MHYKILHIVVHLGGGVGTVILNWVKSDTDNSHTILCLNYTYFKNHWIAYEKKYDEKYIFEKMRWQYDEINTWVKQSDIVIVHFWNHPLLYEFIINANLPETRICTWSHINGFFTPYIHPRKMIEFSDYFILSSPVSYAASDMQGLPMNLNSKLEVIWTTGEVSEFSHVKKEPHDNFNILYLGTLDFSKVHKNFIEMCSKIDIPDANFIVCGTGKDVDQLKQQAEEHKASKKFNFTGAVKSVLPYMAVSDVFGYPSCPTHFGTCEQVIGEAVAAGLIPVVMNNPSEAYILSHSPVRFISGNEEEYIKNIEFLYHNRDQMPTMLDSMQKPIMELYNTGRMISSWNKMFDKVMGSPKRKRRWTPTDEKSKDQGYRILIESLGSYGKILEYGDEKEIRELFSTNPQWKSRSKGSVNQYLECFPDDEKLKEWVAFT